MGFLWVSHGFHMVPGSKEIQGAARRRGPASLQCPWSPGRVARSLGKGDNSWGPQGRYVRWFMTCYKDV